MTDREPGAVVAWITPWALSVLLDPSNERYLVYAEIQDTKAIEASNSRTLENDTALVLAADYEAMRARAEAAEGNAVLRGWADALALISEEEGRWHSCSGCHETEDGYSVGSYAYSGLLGCALGNGCHECGGLGAVWDTTNYADFADTAIAEQGRGG